MREMLEQVAAEDQTADLQVADLARRKRRFRLGRLGAGLALGAGADRQRGAGRRCGSAGDERAPIQLVRLFGHGRNSLCMKEERTS